VIFWKQVGHSMTEPPCDTSHIMCWPHTGQANLNSLMGFSAQTFHIRAALATRIFQAGSRKGAKMQSKVFPPLRAFAPLRETISMQKSVCIRVQLWF
jgi:hypothetical protein